MLLDMQQLVVQIDGATILRGVSMQVTAGETVALIGRNGAGKTTTLRALMGLIPTESGSITYDGSPLQQVKPYDRPGLGIGYAPEDRRLFGMMTVEDNLLLPAQINRMTKAQTDDRLALVYTIVPELENMRSQRAGTLSGGQGKMVALGRALMIGTRLILLDEPFQGLAPVLAQTYAAALSRLRDEAQKLSILITESNPALVDDLAQRTYRIDRGALETLT